MKRLVPALLATLAALLLLVACSQMSVGHLNRQPWELETARALPMKFWRFDYAITPVGDHFAVRGTAFPVLENLPPWARRVDDIWFAAYLSDKAGTVLAQDLRVFEPGPLDVSSGISFAFLLRPDSLPTQGDLFITFGYRMKLTPPTEDGKPAPAPAPGDVFFASEGAMTRF